MRIAILSILTFVVAASAFAQPFPDRLESFKNLGGREIEAGALDQFLEQEMVAAELPGLSFAVISDSRIVYHRTLGVADRSTGDPVLPSTLFEAASLSKPIFAYLVMKQVEKGIIDLDTPLHTYLPYPDIAFDDRYKQITARMVLAHTSGLPNWRTENPDNRLDIAFAPGTDFRYSGEGYQYLKNVLVHILDTDDDGLDRLVQEEVARPLGADRLHFTWNEYVAQHKAMGHQNGMPTNKGPHGNVGKFGAGYSLHTEARGYASFLIAVMRKEGLSPESWQEMLSLQFRFPPDHHEASGEQIGWSLGFGIDSTEYGIRYAHGGNNGDFKAYTHFYQDHDFGVVLFCNADHLFSSGFADKLGEFLYRE